VSRVSTKPDISVEIKVKHKITPIVGIASKVVLVFDLRIPKGIIKRPGKNNKILLIVFYAFN